MTPSLRAPWARLSSPLAAFGSAVAAFFLSSCTAPNAASPSSPPSPIATSAGRQVLNFNPDWRFIRDDVPNAQSATFDDSHWQLVSAPHTYNDVDTFDNWSTPGHRGEQIQWSGRTWYRKSF